MIYTVISKQDGFENLFDEICELCREAEQGFYQDSKNDFAVENFQKRKTHFYINYTYHVKLNISLVFILMKMNCVVYLVSHLKAKM